MSYDIRLFKPRPNEDPLITAHEEGIVREESDSQSISEADQFNRRVALTLMQANPQLQPFNDEEHLNTPIELNTPEGGNGIQKLSLTFH